MYAPYGRCDRKVLCISDVTFWSSGSARTVREVWRAGTAAA
jgi:hypothetical protein